MSNFSLSIIIPVYNGWKYMSKCLESLENQVLLADEIIIGDDCSTDNTFEQLLNYKEHSSLNIILFHNKVNMGPGAVRDYAKKLASSNYIAFCDADDWYEKNFVVEIKEVVDKEHPELIIFDNFNIINNSKIVAGTTKSIVKADKKTILALYPMSLWRFVVSKSIIEKVEFPHLYNGEDGAVAPQLIAKAQQISVIDKPYYNYFFREGSASLKPSPIVFRGLLDSFEIVNNKLKDLYFEEIEYIGIKNVCYGAVLNALKAKIEKKEIYYFVAAFQKSFPQWSKNKYLRNMVISKRLFVWSVKHRVFILTRLMTFLHSKIVT